MASKRFKAIALTVLFASFMLFFNAFEIVESNHDCEGEHCEICRVLEVIEHTRKGLSFSVVCAIAAVAFVFAAVLCIVFGSKRIFSSTLITLKVKLSD